MSGMTSAHFHWLILLLWASTAVVSASSPEEDRWDGRFFLSGIQGEVRAIAMQGNHAYVGGQFTSADDVALTNVARWNGTNWSGLGGGVNGVVNAIVTRGSDTYVGGVFTLAGSTPASCIARWDGANWHALGTGIEGVRVEALAVDAAGLLYAGGEFTNAGSVVVANVACWDGANWSALGTGLRNDPYAAWVLALAVHDTSLYAGGFFTDAGGVNVSCIARWTGTAWSALGAGVDDIDYLPQVTALAVDGDDLYVGGAFTKAGNVSAAHVACWNGASWSALGAGISRYFGDIPVTTLAVSDGDLLVGGRFLMAGGISANNLARWNGTEWFEYAGGVTGSVSTMVTASEIYVGGSFTAASARRPSGLARWDGVEWTVISAAGGEGIYGTRHCVTTAECVGDDLAALTVDGESVVAAGGFTVAGDVDVSNIARWDGTSWSPIGSGLNGHIRALAQSDTTLFAGGQFGFFTSSTSSNIAQWNGDEWLPLGGGINGPVYALALSGDDLYAGGSFTAAGGVPAGHVVCWNGINWSALGSGVDGPVYALAVSDGKLYAGGKFSVAGGSDAGNVACWDGNAWSALDGGVGGVVSPIVRIRPPPVSALAVRGMDLFVGGDFAWAGGVAATNIARWDGSNWHGLGPGVKGAAALAAPPTVRTLLVNGDELYVGGSIKIAGELPAQNLAMWDGSQWSVLDGGVWLGLGVPPAVEALALSRNKLYLGGHFKFAGNKPASGFAIRHPPQSPTLAIMRVGEAVVLSWSAAAENYWLQAAESLSPPDWLTLTNIPALVGSRNVVTNEPVQPLRFFRLLWSR